MQVHTRGLSALADTTQMRMSALFKKMVLNVMVVLCEGEVTA